MLNLKGYQGHSGLEAYDAFETYNLGSQVANGALVAKAIEVGADAILVSQTVTGQDAHIHNLTELVEILEAEGRRGELILAAAGRASPTSLRRSWATTAASRAARTRSTSRRSSCARWRRASPPPGVPSASLPPTPRSSAGRCCSLA